MTIKTDVKAGADGLTVNHNETLAVRSAVKAGGLITNHNESFRR
ncbi:MAG TPA: hypothetical protein VH394_01030 [Thermoanaerobaculia bacterium]|jgi:hypothetical protein|nr:hypothetical protein [Thermoanaerobaculia bacterium]